MVSTDQRARDFFVPVSISWTVHTKAIYPFPTAPAARRKHSPCGCIWRYFLAAPRPPCTHPCGVQCTAPWGRFTLQWVLFIGRRLPQSLPDTVEAFVQWLQHKAEWHGGRYTSWHLRHRGPCSDFCADWSFDLPVILSVSRLLSKQPRVESTGRGVLRCPMGKCQLQWRF